MSNLFSGNFKNKDKFYIGKYLSCFTDENHATQSGNMFMRFNKNDHFKYLTWIIHIIKQYFDIQ